MSLYTIGDLHLSLGSDKPMDIFGGWESHTERILKNWSDTVGEGDLTVIPGDISWAMNFEGAKADFAFIEKLPGRKILLKGNHDYWWNTMAKMKKFLSDNCFNSINILHNNYYEYEGYGICGTRGWINDSDEPADAKVLAREAARLEASIAPAVAAGLEPLAFLHYPPVFLGDRNEEILRTLHKYGVKKCYYGHVHGAAHKNAAQGMYEDIRFELVSSDFLQFCPKTVI